MSPVKVFFQETRAQYQTLAVCQNEYYPQGSRRVEEFRVWERAAEQPAAHPVCFLEGYRDVQGGTSSLEGQASGWFPSQHAHFSRGNTREYLAHIVAVLHITKQKGLDTKCKKLGKAVVRQSKTLKNLLKATGSKDTILLDVDVRAQKVEIEQTQQMLQESQKAHNKAIAKTYKQLRNLLSGNLQSQWDRICHEIHKHD